MRSIFVLCVIFVAIPLVSVAKCTGRFVNPVTDVCWPCLFPLTLGASNMAKNSLPDTKNPSNPVCVCKVSNVPRVGLAVGFWEPAALVEVVREPFCFPTLGGLKINLPFNKRQGTVAQTKGGHSSEYHVHVIQFPILSLLGLITDGLCGEPPDIHVLLPSELDPTWQNEGLALMQHPEAALVANYILQETCSLDCTKANLGLPLNHLFWCQGCQGSLYPFTGRVAAHIGGVQASNLLAGRALAKWHRLGVLWKTSGNTPLAICQKRPALWLPKNTYRLSMAYPRPSTGEKGCLPLGRSTLLMESNHEYPVKGEDFGWLVWRKKNCCAGI